MRRRQGTARREPELSIDLLRGQAAHRLRSVALKDNSVRMLEGEKEPLIAPMPIREIDAVGFEENREVAEQRLRTLHDNVVTAGTVRFERDIV